MISRTWGNSGATTYEYTGYDNLNNAKFEYNYIPGGYGTDDNSSISLTINDEKASNYKIISYSVIKYIEEEFIPNTIARTADLESKADISLVTEVEAALYNAIVENDLEDKAYVNEVLNTAMANKADKIHIHNWNEIENKPFSIVKEYICENITSDDFGNYYYDNELDATRWKYNLSDNEYQLLLSNVDTKPLYYRVTHNDTLYEGIVSEYKVDENDNLIATEWLSQDSRIGFKIENNILYYYIGAYEWADVDFNLYLMGDKEYINEENIPDSIARVSDLENLGCEIVSYKELEKYGAEVIETEYNWGANDSNTGYNIRINLNGFMESPKNYIFSLKPQIDVNNYDSTTLYITFKMSDGRSHMLRMSTLHLAHDYLYLYNNKADSAFKLYFLLTKQEIEIEYDENGNVVLLEFINPINTNNILAKLNDKIMSTDYVPEKDTDVLTKGYIGGTVEITSGEPEKENTVLTINPEAEEVNIYTAEEIDEKLSKINNSSSNSIEIVYYENMRILEFSKGTSKNYEISNENGNVNLSSNEIEITDDGEGNISLSNIELLNYNNGNIIIN